MRLYLGPVATQSDTGRCYHTTDKFKATHPSHGTNESALQMLYLVRGPDGTVQTVSRQALQDSTPVEDHAPEVVEFFNRNQARGFNESDADFVRVLEDLIDTLITNNVIRHTDLPPAAQKKLMLRKGLRSRISGALDFMGNDERLL